MFTPSFRITPGMFSNVEQLGRIMGLLQAVRLPGVYAQELLATVEAEIIHASTAIEGNTLTQEQVTEVLRGQPVQALRRDIQEVKNYQATLAYIHDIAAGTATFTHQTILYTPDNLGTAFPSAARGGRQAGRPLSHWICACGRLFLA